MPGLPRPTPDRQILDLARRLAEDYDAVPLPEVCRVVSAAAAVATGDGAWSGTAEGIPVLLEVIEVIAREDLDRGVGVPPRLSRVPAVPAPAAADRSERRQGVA